MNIFKKILALGTVSVLLTACLGGDVVFEYNNAAIAAHTAITENLDDMLTKQGAELDKEKDINFDFLNQNLTEGNTKIRKSISDIKALQAPAGEGVQEFHTLLTQIADQTEAMLKLNEQYVKANKDNNSKALDNLSDQLNELGSKISELEDKLSAAQEEMAKKNNFDLK